MGKVWYLARDGQQYGPFTEDEVSRQLEEGSVDAGYHAFKPGMSKWTPIDELSEFSELASRPPPPPPPAARPGRSRPADDRSHRDAVYDRAAAPGNGKGHPFWRLVMTLLLAGAGYYAGTYLQYGLIDIDRIADTPVSEEALIGAGAGFVLGLILFSHIRFFRTLGVLLGAVAAAVAIYQGWLKYQETLPHQYDIAGTWQMGALQYRFEGTGGKQYNWRLVGFPSEAGRAWFNPDDSITAVIQGKEYKFLITRLSGTCPTEIKDSLKNLTLTRSSSCP